MAIARYPIHRRRSRVPAHKSCRGFTIVELLCAAVVLTVGMVAILGLFAYAISTLQYSTDELIAKQKARETLEAIYSARSTGQISYDQIQNTGSGGIFLDGPQPLKQSGNDGLFGTSDDGDYDYIVVPGPDGTLQNGTKQYLTNYSREIKFGPVKTKDKNGNETTNPDIRNVTVTVKYTVQNAKRSTKVVGMISRYR